MRPLPSLGLMCFSLALGCQDEFFVTDFDYHLEGECSDAKLEVHFENFSPSATGYVWDFGDETWSSEPNPIKVYDKAGNYAVKLYSYYDDNHGVASKNISIPRNSDGTGPVISIVATNSGPDCKAFNIELTVSGATSYRLDFGDGTDPDEDGLPGITDSVEFLVVDHVYTVPGTFILLILATGDEGSTCEEVKIQIDSFIGC